VNMWRDGNGSIALSLSCFSLNGLLLNSDFVQQGSGDRRLAHGDVLAFAANMELVDRGSAPRRPFLAFIVECEGVLPRQSVVTDDHELVALPEATVEGCWHGSDAFPLSLDDVFFRVTVHGENVRNHLTDEQRSLFLCWSGNLDPPTLRIGRHYQKKFWQQLLNPDFHAAGWSESMEGDHFEIRVLQRIDPTTCEPMGWQCRVKGLSSTALKMNYSVTCICGKEYDLYPSDMLTLITHSSGSDVSGLLHFTYIPVSDTLSAPHAQFLPVRSEEPRELPELLQEDGAKRIDGTLVLERNPSICARVNSTALQAPIEIDSDCEPSATPDKLPSMDEGCDDLFSQTGFGLGGELLEHTRKRPS